MIYLLHESPSECVKMLDDATLSEMIGEIAQVLCSVHYNLCDDLSKCDHIHNAPDFIGEWQKDNAYSQWTRECVANYAYMCALGMACCKEHAYRFERHAAKYGDEHYFDAIHWCNDNRPELPGGQMLATADMPSSEQTDLITPFPTCVPQEYIDWSLAGYKDNRFATETYRNYYRAVLPKDAKFTRRQKPEFLKD